MYIYIIIGFIAQLIDGTMGMAYGITCSSFLKMVGNIPLKSISVIVHWAEIPTSFISGFSHWKLHNVEKTLFLKLFFSGITGSIIGVCFLSLMGNNLELFISIYLMVTGMVILARTIKKGNSIHKLDKGIYVLGLLGGFFDAIGGGGWGPIVTTTLLGIGYDPQKTVGSVNAAEFFICLVEIVSFAVLSVDFSYNKNLFGLIIGGVCAAPISAWLCGKISKKLLLFIVGVTIILTNVYSLVIWSWL